MKQLSKILVGFLLLVNIGCAPFVAAMAETNRQTRYDCGGAQNHKYRENSCRSCITPSSAEEHDEDDQEYEDR